MRKFFGQGVILGLFFLLHFTTLSFMGFRFSSYCFADTDVGGSVRGNTVWSLDKSPYVVKSSIVVVSDATLTIEPGVTVCIQDAKAIQVDGTLIARGTAEAKIIFTAYQKSPLVRWGYILFTNSSVDAKLNCNNYVSGSILEHCIVEYANGGDRKGTVVCEKASPFITYCEIKNNTPSGINASSSGLRIANCNIHNNSSSGIALYSSNATIEMCTISYNTTTSYGGGIMTTGGALTIISTIIQNNSSSQGGGIYSGGTLTVISTKIINNKASNSGGGINSNGNSTISSSIISGNNAKDGGGISASGLGAVFQASQCCINNNLTTGNGGGLYLYALSSYNVNGISTFSYCNICNNTANSGGGVFICSSKCKISQSLLLNNSATGNHGACIFEDCDSTYNSLTLTYNTISGNNNKNSVIYLILNSAAPIITNNNIYSNNTIYDIYGIMPSTAAAVNATNNYWGTVDESKICERIYDFFDDSTKGKVNYYPFFNEPYVPQQVFQLIHGQDSFKIIGPDGKEENIGRENCLLKICGESGDCFEYNIFGGAYNGHEQVDEYNQIAAAIDKLGLGKGLRIGTKCQDDGDDFWDYIKKIFTDDDCVRRDSRAEIEIYKDVSVEFKGTVWNWCHLDVDGDGYGNPFIIEGVKSLCSTNFVPDPYDCDDCNLLINPSASEACDNIDNDCDGKIDQDLAPRPCSTACGRGTETCTSGKWAGCTAPQPKTEVCDGQDNDCDGMTDEDLPGCKAEEICDGKDNDGDGKIDEDLTQPCSTVCGKGMETCQNGKWVNCTAPQPQAEVCDGKDNDCDAKIDEDLSQPCSTPCGTGTETCRNGKWAGCTALQPQTEICDGKDNDCDGTIDEGCPSPQPSFKCGDADGNGSVDISDALLIAEYDVGLKDASRLPGLKYCDVTGDGSVDLFDALKIAEYDVGLVSKLECVVK